MSHRAAELERQLWGPNATDFRLSPNGRNRRVSPIAVPPGEGPFTDPLRTHSSRIANRYFVETTAYGRASRLIMGFAQLNPSYKETTERIQNAARPPRIASLISAASGRCRWEFAARTSPLDIMS